MIHDDPNKKQGSAFGLDDLFEAIFDLDSIWELLVGGVRLVGHVVAVLFRAIFD